MPTVLIIGAGLAGLAASIRFGQLGYTSKVFERTSSPKTIGGAINIAPNGVRLLDRLGVLDEVRNQGCTVRSFELYNHKGVYLGSFPNCSSDGFVGIRIMRSSLQMILLDEAKKQGADVEFEKALESLKQEGTQVFATLSDGTVAEGDLVIGADGIHSRVRQYVTDPDQKDPVYTGMSLVYGLLDTNALSPDDVASMPATSGVFGLKCFFASAFCNEERSRLYWISSRTKPVAEKLDDPAVIRSEELEKFSDFLPPVIPAIIKHTTEFFSWPIYELPVLDHWSTGNVVLIGDAAHALPPDKGQGFSQAIEDIFVLARVIEKGANLSRYEEIRKPRVEKLREVIRRDKKERDTGPWTAWFRDWSIWVFLKGLSLIGSRWADSTFGYDPDSVAI
jgi:2-polyprenyl-6-methoxyphenol hydroxylase-like FAD-dependent oxidoreductase